MLTKLESPPRKALVLLAWRNRQLDTLRAQQTTHHQALEDVLFLLWITIALHPPRKLPYRLASTIKLSTQLTMKLRMDKVSW